MNQVKHFINLTNGIEILEDAQTASKIINGIHFVRIQSTHLEQKHMAKVIDELDYNLLMNLAIGNTCILYDYGSRRKDYVSRVLWQGIPWIQYVLCRRWLGEKLTTNINGHDCTEFFDFHYNLFDQHTKKKLDYFKPFLVIEQPSDLKLIGSFNGGTDHDGDKLYYSHIIKLTFG